YNEGGGISRTRPRGSTAGGRFCGTTDDESVPSAGLVREMRMMREAEPGARGPIRPLDWLKIIPFEPAPARDPPGRGGPGAAAGGGRAGRGRRGGGAVH